MIDFKKPVQTRAGRKARILATDILGEYPIVAVYREGSGDEHVIRYLPDGRYSKSMTSPYDLVNAPEKRIFEAWVNIYSGYFVTYTDELAAMEHEGDKLVKRIHIRQEYEV